MPFWIFVAWEGHKKEWHELTQIEAQRNIYPLTSTVITKNVVRTAQNT